MPVMEWNERFALGIDQVDSEHRRILDAMNDLFDHARDGTNGSLVLKDLDYLVRVTTDHFAHEEAYFDSFGYKDAERHKLIHKSLLSKLAAHQQTIIAAQGRVTKDFFDFLRFWLSAHILGIDKKYADVAKGVAA